MKVSVISLFSFAVLCAASPELEEDGLALDRIVESGDYPDPIGSDADLDKKKFLEETGISEMDPSLQEEFKEFAKKMYDNSEDLQKAVEEVKDINDLDLKHRYRISAAFWGEMRKNRKLYKPQLRSMGKKLPSSIKDKISAKLSKTWKSLKSFFKHPIKSITGDKSSSHNVQKRLAGVGLLFVILAGSIVFTIFVFFVLPLLICSALDTL